MLILGSFLVIHTRGQPRHCLCTHAGRGLSSTAEFLVYLSGHVFYGVIMLEINSLQWRKGLGLQLLLRLVFWRPL